MLTVKFFQVNDKARHNGNVVDTTPFSNVAMQVADYIKNVMTWGYDKDEIIFSIDSTCEDYEATEISRAIRIYAKEI